MKKAELNIATTLINQLVMTACGIVVPGIFINAFGSEAYGISVSVTQFLSYITLLESGVGGVARAMLYGPLAHGDERGVSSVYYAVKRFFGYIAVAFAAYSAAVGLLYPKLAHVTIFSGTYIFFLVLVIGMSTLAKYMGGLANLTLIAADQRQYVNNIISVGITIANTLSILILTELDCGLLTVKLGSSIIFVIRPLLYMLYVKKHYRLSRAESEKTKLEQKWTGIGQHLAYFLHTNTDVVLLTLFANTRLVAVYSVYNLVISSIRAITESFSGGMEAAFGEMIANGETDRLKKSYFRYKTLITAVSFGLFSCAGILIVPFVRLYTKGVTDADYIQPAFSFVLMLAEAVNCIVLPCSNLPVAANRLKQTRWGAYGEAIINIAVSCILIKWSPLLGVAVGTLAATLFRGIFYMTYSSKKLLHIPTRTVIVNFIAAVTCLCIVTAAGRYITLPLEIENYFQWILCGAAVFTAVCLPIMLIAGLRIRRLGIDKKEDGGNKLPENIYSESEDEQRAYTDCK